MFLFPKYFASDSEKNSTAIVLKDKFNNRVTIPLRSTISFDSNNCLVASNDEFQKIDVSKKDLKSIYDQFNSIHKADVLRENDCDANISLESFFINQEAKLQELISSVAEGDEDNVLHQRLPTKEHLTSTNEYIVRLEQEIINILKEKADTQPSDNCNTAFSKLPRILREEDSENDLIAVKMFATEFRTWRISMDLSQMDVAISIDLVLKVRFSQTTICRFEAMGLNFSNMTYLIPYFRKWLKKIYANGVDNNLRDVKEHKKQAHMSEGSNSNQEEEEINEVGQVEEMEVSSEEDNLKRKNRVKRVVYTEEQKATLENLFQTVKYTQITAHVYKKFEKILDLPIKKIKTWMSKRRRTMRQEEQIIQRRERR